MNMTLAVYLLHVSLSVEADALSVVVEEQGSLPEQQEVLQLLFSSSSCFSSSQL
jgi:hypothetical protein